MSLSVLLSSFGIIFLAEFGDKTQLAAMALAAKHPWKKIFPGIAAAFVVLNAAAVVFGKVVFAFLPLFWIKVVAGLLFLFFGVSSIRASDEEEGEEPSSAKSPMAKAFAMIFLAELGDKTQIVTAALAAQHSEMFSVFAGSTLALWSVALIGIFLGKQISRVVPLPVVHHAAGALFLVFGGIMLYQAWGLR